MAKILVGVTGSVAAIKLPALLDELAENLDLRPNRKLQIRVVVTEHAQHFFKETALPSCRPLYKDEDEWAMWKGRGDPVLHIDLAKWADIFVIAPLDANTLGKISSGLCDNLLTCIVRAWDTEKPLLFCPAMNTKMWEHPITEKQINTLLEWGYHLVPCVSKKLMCGDTGFGAMAEVKTIIEHVQQFVVR